MTPSPASIASTVAVTTVSFGSDAVLPAFIDSVERASSRHPLLVVADNKADDGARVRQLVEGRGASYLAMPGNHGYGNGLNAAVASLPPEVEWVLLSNPDVILEPESIDALIAMGESDDRIAAVGPRVMTPEGTVYPSARAVPSLRTGIGHALFANIWVGNPWTRAYRKDTENDPVQRDAGWLSGSCVLVRRRVFQEIGGFDTGYFMYFEDVDLGYRFGKAGYRNVYEPNAVVVHTGAHSTTSDSARMIAAHHESAKRFLNRKYSGRLLAPVRLALRVGLAVRSRVLERRPGHH